VAGAAPGPQIAPRDLPQRVVGEQAVEATILLLHLGGELRCRFTASQLPNAGGGTAEREIRLQHGFAAYLTATALVGLLVSAQANRFALRQHHQHLPQILAVIEPREVSLFDAAQEIMECGQHDIFFVRHATWQVTQLATGQPEESLQVTLPELRRGGRLASLELAEPHGHGRRCRGR
jgi:hypothetical protein